MKGDKCYTHPAQLVLQILLPLEWVVAGSLSAAHLVESPFAVLHHTLHHSSHTPHIRSNLGPPCYRPQQGLATEKPPQFGLEVVEKLCDALVQHAAGYPVAAVAALSDGRTVPHDLDTALSSCD
ncbi:hypothetical protein E2C01_011834 [Portunus trituberculatus]|uniref:Secreted protein n=1 Tax=Portunus trituberculatus TaxID=210409 RepID=A0A5B7DD17_PORTR|nr:hypothetical protein [Portunus trituberculatus]